MAGDAPSLSDNIAVITGAGDGIGKAIALKLASKTCNIALVDINKDKLTAVTQHLRSLYPSQTFHSFICDVSNESEVKKLVNAVKSSFNTSKIQLLFNNVGISSLTTVVLSSDTNLLKKLMNVNLWSMIYCTRAFLPLLTANPPSKQCYIVNTGSIASLETGFSMYSITKHSVIAFSETIREELKRLYRKQNILVSTLVPGFVNTNIRQMSSKILDVEKEWNEFIETDLWKNKKGKMVHMTKINVDRVADLVYELGIKQKKCVIPTHFEWHEAVIKDRMNALLNCEKDKKLNMRKAVRQSMANSKL
eukprot:466054_1